MSTRSKSFALSAAKLFRRVFAKPLRELSRTGKIIQTLWDAAQLQKQQRAYYQKIGEIVAARVRERKLSDIEIEKVIFKIDQIEKVLSRQDIILRSYQDRTDLRQILKEYRQQTKDRLEPV